MQDNREIKALSDPKGMQATHRDNSSRARINIQKFRSLDENSKRVG
jgi:hypothetical protein